MHNIAQYREPRECAQLGKECGTRRLDLFSQVLTQLITLHAHGIRPRTCRAELARKRPAGEQSPGRPLYYLYSSEKSGKLQKIYGKGGSVGNEIIM